MIFLLFSIFVDSNNQTSQIMYMLSFMEPSQQEYINYICISFSLSLSLVTFSIDVVSYNQGCYFLSCLCGFRSNVVAGEERGGGLLP